MSSMDIAFSSIQIVQKNQTHSANAALLRKLRQYLAQLVTHIKLPPSP
ncbi:hypothetical protein [Acetobacter pomorum]|nr:hypothetical protein [Acetobacter pomorum]